MNTRINIKNITIEYDLDTNVFKEQMHKFIFTVIKERLTPREFGVLRARYFKQWTRKRIAEVYNVSESRIAQIERKALKKCRRRDILNIVKYYLLNC